MEKRIWEWEGESPWKKLAAEATELSDRLFIVKNKHRGNAAWIENPRLPDTADYAQAFEIPIKRLIVETTLRLAKSIVSEEAQRKGRILFLLDLTTDCYAELRELDRMEAEKKEADKKEADKKEVEKLPPENDPHR
jgi:hypothetical protein